MIYKGLSDAPKISYDIPVPVGNQFVKGKAYHWRSVILGMKPGGSFDLTGNGLGDAQKAILRAAKVAGVAVKTRKLENGGLRVWRAK